MTRAPIKIKKVSPYPIDGDLISKAETQKGRIVKLTGVGLLIETKKALSLGDQLSIRFIIPVHDKEISSQVVVIKTYIRYGGEGGEKTSHHLNELHFRNLTDTQKIDIHKFLQVIKQG